MLAAGSSCARDVHPILSMPSRPHSRRILLLIAAAGALLVFFLSSSRPLGEQEREQHAVAALIACENELARRRSLRVRLSANHILSDAGDQLRANAEKDLGWQGCHEQEHTQTSFFLICDLAEELEKGLWSCHRTNREKCQGKRSGNQLRLPSILTEPAAMERLSPNFA